MSRPASSHHEDLGGGTGGVQLLVADENVEEALGVLDRS
jgi:hypothetical protein